MTRSPAKKKAKQLVRAESILNIERSINAREGYFNDILFIPFNLKWRVMMAVMILISCILNVNIFVLDGVMNTFRLETFVTQEWTKIALYVTEVVYIVDLVLLSLHRLIKRLQVTKPYRAESKCLLVFCYITIVPSTIGIIQFVYDVKGFEWVRLLVILRSYKVIFMYRYLLNSTYLSPITVVVATLLLMSSLIVTFVLMFIFYMNYTISGFQSPEEALRQVIPLLDRRVLESWPLKTETDMLTWAYFMGGTCLFSRGPLNIYPSDVLALVVYQIWMLLTLVMKMLTIGIFASVFVNKYKRNLQFNAEKEVIKMKMDSMELSKSVRKAVNRWYDTVWSAREGITDSEALQLLPFGLYRDCCFDSYCTSLKHSKLFRKLDPYVAAELSFRMETVFHSKGDIIYKQGMWKDMMIYIQRGVVHTMSTYDDNTPIVSLFPGSCFGETHLFVSFPVKRKVVCATYCELKILKRSRLYELSDMYPEEMKRWQNVVSERYRKAFLLSAMREIRHLKWMNAKIGIHEDGPLKRIKQLARAVDRSFSKSIDKFDIEDKLTILLESDLSLKMRYVGSCSDYIDTLVISDYDQDKNNRTFVKMSCPVIIHPSSPFVWIWNLLIHAGVIFMTFTIPLEAGLGVRVNALQFWFSLLFQFIFVIDVMLQCVIAVISETGMIKTVTDIFQYRMATLEYKADLLGSVPINVIFILFPDDIQWSTWGYSKLNYVLRIWRIFKLSNRWVKRSYNTRELFLLLSCSFVVVLFLSYWSMIFSSLSCFDKICNPKAMWVMLERTTENRVDAVYVTVRTFLNTLLMCFGLAGGYVVPFTKAEHIALLIMSGTFFFFDILVIATTCAAVIHIKNSNEMKREDVIEMVNLSVKYNLTSELEYRVFRQIKTQQVMYNTELFKGSSQAPHLSHDLTKELKKSIWSTVLLCVPLFAYTDRKFIYDTLDNCISRVFPPNEIIAYSGVLMEYMYVIMKGYVQVMGHKSEEPEGFKGPGWHFGFLEALLDIPMTKSIKSKTSCECLVFRRRDLNEMFKKYPQYGIEVRNTVKQCKALIDIPIVEGFDKMEFEGLKLEKENNFHHFGYNLAVGSKAESEFLKPFGKYSFLSYLLLRSVILPSSYAVWTLELLRSIFALANCLLVPPKIVFLYKSSYFSILYIFLDITAYIDIYLRMHVAYYNHVGVLVTHPLMTAKHYLKTSFIVDLIACFPFDTFFVHLASGMYGKYWLSYNRVIQIHRLLGLLKHIYSRQLIPSPHTETLKFFIILVVAMNVLASISFLNGCFVSRNIQIMENGILWDGIRCPNLIYNAPVFGKHVKPRSMYMYFQYYITTLLNQFNVMKAGRDKGSGAYVLFICVLSYILVSSMSANVSALIFLQNSGRKFQEKVKEMMQFLNNNGVPRELSDEFNLYYNTLWEQYQGKTPKSILAIVNKTLEGDVIYHIYGRHLKEFTIFSKTTSTFIRNLLFMCDAQIFHKGCTVLSEGYVHSNIYLLFEGYVVVRHRGRPVIKLNKGSFFGNLHNVSSAQQTVNVLATTNVEVLVMKSSKFYYILNAYPHYKEMFVSSLKVHADKGVCVISSIVPFDEDQDIKSSVNQPMWFRSAKYETFKAVLALMSSFATLYSIATREFTIPFVGWLFILDIISLTSIVINCRMPFVDLTGELERNSIEIKRHYRNTDHGFWFDVMTSFPLESVWFLFKKKRRAYLQLRANRVLKYILFWCYLRNYQKRISAEQFKVRIITGLIRFYSLLFMSTSLFLATFIHFENEYIEYSIYMRLNQFLHMFVKQLSDYTHYPHEIVLPYVQIPVLVVRILQMILTTIVIAVIVGQVLFYMDTVYFDVLNYLEIKTKILRCLKLQDISIYLYNKVDTYLTFLWDFDYGSQQPEVLTLTPVSLQLKLMKCLYERHLKNHFFFQNCHTDFFDQVILHLARQKILPDGLIVRQGTKDKSIYFIHEGVINVYYSDDDGSEVYTGELGEGDYFGTSQGLNCLHPHLNTYRGRTTAVVLRLCYDKWSYLLKHFPHEEAKIRSFRKEVQEYEYDL